MPVSPSPGGAGRRDRDFTVSDGSRHKRSGRARLFARRARVTFPEQRNGYFLAGSTRMRLIVRTIRKIAKATMTNSSVAWIRLP